MKFVPSFILSICLDLTGYFYQRCSTIFLIIFKQLETLELLRAELISPRNQSTSTRMRISHKHIPLSWAWRSGNNLFIVCVIYGRSEWLRSRSYDKELLRSCGVSECDACVAHYCDVTLCLPAKTCSERRDIAAIIKLHDPLGTAYRPTWPTLVALRYGSYRTTRGTPR
jgi:hypothetical protein